MTINLISTLDPNEWPPIWTHCFNLWKDTTSYDIKLWNKNSMINELKSDDEEFYNQYLSHLSDMFQIEYFRYTILEKYGGGFFDLDIELVIDFLPLLHDDKIYFMEGTGGTYVENSIMIAGPNSHKEIWTRLKSFTKHNIMLNFTECKSNPYSIVEMVGPMALSKFCIKGFPPETSPRFFFDILAFEHFGNTKSSLSFTRHHQTAEWNKENS
jgi:mannosyltransferase OCH1-like enzyme